MTTTTIQLKGQSTLAPTHFVAVLYQRDQQEVASKIKEPTSQPVRYFPMKFLIWRDLLERSGCTLDLTRNKLVDIPMDISKLINMQRLLMVKCCPPPPATTFLALHPKFIYQ
ncbi:hypothetical protein Pint_13135 [Pistacia integerrima]|uniref:Uncharacterized protein n=1 Tax=Pistacia integerrima TaxID=434235 RepID=A0ACC0Y479_9ROSI|nr:hypothetical protein Pint_13135 [Pistacia integerrima]